MSDAEKRLTFHHKRLHQKAAVVAAGPLANFLLTIAVLTFLIMTHGLPSTEPIVGEIMPNTPAQTAGLQPGDRIVSVGGESVETFGDIPRIIAVNLGTPVEIILRRGEKMLTLHIVPQSFDDTDTFGNKITRPLIGFKSTKQQWKNVSLPVAVWEATRKTYDICATTLKAVGQMVAGKRTAKELKGPLGIAKLSGQAAEKDTYTVLWFIAMLSANLGLVNLFPIPLLDGGHLVYYGVEALRGRPMAERFQEYGYKLGFLLIFSLMAFAIFNDLRDMF